MASYKMVMGIPKFVTKFPSTTQTNMLSSISKFQKIIWDKWNVRVVIIFSLFLQIFLIVSAPSRKRTRSFFISFVWLAYLLADWAAAYCIGLISSNQEQKPSLSQNDNLMAFWGPFLLLHLGGPDTISAFAMEDNELWLRHLLGLIVESIMAAYVFLLTLPRNTLWIPTILMFVAGLIKYVERTHALYVAAINNFRKSLFAELTESHSRKEADHPADSSNARPANVDSLPLVRRAFYLFKRLQGLIVDMTYYSEDRTDVKYYFQSINALEALELIEIELNFMYEVFYTKAPVIRQYWFWSRGKFVSLISIIAAFVLFIKAERHGGFDQLDVRVTYALLSAALVLDVIALVMRLFTDHTATLSDEDLIDNGASFQKLRARLFKNLHERILAGFLNWRKPTWSKIKEGPYEGCEKLSTNFLFRRWSGSISGHNLLKYCLDESVRRDSNINLHGSFYIGRVIRREYFRIVGFVQEHLLDRWRYPSTNPFLKELWECIQKKMKEKSDEAVSIKDVQTICSERGYRVVQNESEILKELVDPDEVSFDKSLLMWHIATTLCFYANGATLRMEGHKREIISMIISDYMLYLLIMQPNMMSSIAGNGQIRFRDTCEEAKSFFKEKKISAQGDREAMLKEACEGLMKISTSRSEPSNLEGMKSKSVLFSACCLVMELDKLPSDKKWEIINSVWVELLSYAACHCRPTGHVQLLSKGGELISFVWLSMAHWGLSPQFQEKQSAGLTGGRAWRAVISDQQIHHQGPKVVVVTPDMGTDQTVANDSLTRTFAGEHGKVNLQKPIGLEEDPAAPGIRQPHTASDGLSKITDPIRAGADICPSPSRNQQREKQGEVTTSSSMGKVNYG